MKSLVYCIGIMLFVVLTALRSGVVLGSGKGYENFVGKDCPGGSYTYCDGYLYYLQGKRCGTYFKDQGMSQRSLSDARQALPFCTGSQRKVFYVSNAGEVMNWIQQECASPAYVVRRSITVGPAGRVERYCQLK